MAAALLALVAVLLATGVVAATAPRPLRTAVDDETGRLTDRTRILDAFQRVADQNRIQLSTLFVQTTDGIEINRYGQEVARLSGLDDRDALLVVALGDQTSTIWISDALEDDISTAEQERIRTQQVNPRLRAGDLVGAVTDFAAGIGAAAPASGATPNQPGTTAQPTQPASGVPPASTGGGGGGASIPIILGILLLVGGVLWIRGRVVKGKAVANERVANEQLGREANALLLQTDDLVRDARQEIGFAEAQFGADAVKPFQQQIEGAAAELKAAFMLGQELDDAVPEPPERRQEMLKEIVARTGTARTAVEQVRAAIEGLQDLEKSAPELLQALPAQIDAVEGRIPAAEATLQRLNVYAPSTWQSVANNVSGARERLAAARKDLEEGRASAAATPPEMAQAALKARNAQREVAQAQTLLEGIDKLAGSLNEMQRQLSAELGAASADVTSAQKAIAAGSVSGMETQLAQAQAALAAAEQEARNEKPDIVSALRQASNANQLADGILDGIREAAAARQRHAQMAASAVSTADSNVARVRDFIESRRGVYRIGRMARNRLVEAERRADLARSLLGTDEARATLEAQNADRLADAAYQLAMDDVESAESGVYVDPYGGQGTVVSHPAGGLGGLLGVILGGGGGGTWGGGSWGGWGGGSSGGWTSGGGGWSSGGWGGGGGGRSIGGGWSGGGGGGGGGGGRSSGGGW